MPLPTTISDLFTLESSNSPSGGESPILTDNYLRFLASFIAQLRDGPGFVTAVRSNALGSVSVPAFSFVGDTNTGAWSPAADSYAVSTGGVEQLRIDGTGILNIGAGQVYKDASGNVGIGTAAPSTKLHVVGSTTLGTAVADTLSVGGAVVKNSTGNWTITAPSSGTALTVDGLVQSRALAAAGASAGSFGASSWLTQNEAGIIRTYYCGPSGAVYQPWEIYRATSTGSPLAVLTLSAAGNVTIEVPNSGVGLTVAGGGMTVTGQVVVSPGSYVGIGRTSNLAVKLDVDGALALSVPISTSAATFAVLPDHSAIRCAATCTLSLPVPVSCPGRIITICNVGAFAVTNATSDVFPLGSATAGTAILAATSGKFAQLQSNGTNWVTLMAN